MKTEKQLRNYTLKIFHSQKVERAETKSIVRFLRRARLIKWQDTAFKVYLRVSYGTIIDGWEKRVTSYNDGTYTNKKDFDLALNAFLEK